MSIIHDALKKTGQPVIADNEKASPARPSLPGTPARKEPLIRPSLERPRGRATNWTPLLVLAVLALVAVPLVAPRFFQEGPAGTARSVSMGREVSPDLRAQFGVEEVPIVPVPPIGSKTVPVAPAGTFKLTGVVYSQAESYCLLNGRVVKQGEKVGGATVERITPDQVVLNYNGETITVPVTPS